MDTIGEGRETYKKYWEPIFKKFYEKLGKIFQYAQEKLIGSFEQKVRRMDHFCICLFGRTKAGKSFTMEALTRGDGRSIGLGRQNTTRDIKEYLWNLCLPSVLTPHFGFVMFLATLSSYILRFQYIAGLGGCNLHS